MLEGESDGNFFRNRPFPQKINIVICYGWENVISVCSRAKEKGILGKIIAVLDRDYRKDKWDMHEAEYEVILTDSHSIESMMYWSSAFYTVITEFASPKLKQNFGSADNFRCRLATLCAELGRYRIYCSEKNIPIKFHGMNYGKILSRKTFTLTVSTFLAHLKGFTENKDLISDNDWIYAQTYILDKRYSDVEHICHGHDIMNFLAISLQKVCGNMPGNTTGKDMEKYFRLSYANEELVKTNMWGKIIKRMTKQNFKMLGQAS